jgi:AcrR family transcriptional regulator
MEQNDTDAGETTRARILASAESLLRRYGLEKMTVLDVARALNMSHGNVYRHFPSKAALRAAVIERWLNRIADQTEAIARKVGPADIRLVEWLRELATIKQRKVTEDAEMLAAGSKVVKEMPQIERAHSLRLTSQVAQILQSGLDDGTLPSVQDPHATAKTILNATVRFYHPDLVANGGTPAVQLAALDAVASLIMSGLKRTTT